MSFSAGFLVEDITHCVTRLNFVGFSRYTFLFKKKSKRRGQWTCGSTVGTFLYYADNNSREKENEIKIHFFLSSEVGGHTPTPGCESQQSFSHKIKIEIFIAHNNIIGELLQPTQTFTRKKVFLSRRWRRWLELLYLMTHLINI